MTDDEVKKCLYCNRPSTRLCDYIIGMLGVEIEESAPDATSTKPKITRRMVYALGAGKAPDPETFTCDSPLCDLHATRGSPIFRCGDHCDIEAVDYCPEHRGVVAEPTGGPMYRWDADRARMALRLKASLRVSRIAAQRWLD